MTSGKHEIVVRNLATLVMQRETLETSVARGDLIEPLAVIRTVNAINRTMRLLGLAPSGDEDYSDSDFDEADAPAWLKSSGRSRNGARV